MIRENLQIGVIGMSVAGLPIANDFAKQYPVIVYDLEEEFNGDPSVDHAPLQVPDGSSIEVVQDPGRFSEIGLLIIAVPVTISASRHADLSLLMKACEVAGRNMKKGAVVLIASTVYPGATEEKCIPALERYSGLESGKHFFVGFTADAKKEEADIPAAARVRKVIAGQNRAVLDYLSEVWHSVYRQQVFKAESIRIAEAAEFVTVIQQTVNNALMNELAAIFNLMDIDTQEVLRTAAATKDFLKFSPGFSGNHIKTQDSHQLIQRALAVGHHPEILIASLRVHDSIGNSIANAIIKEMNQFNLPLQTAAVTVIGVTIREDSAVIDKSKVFDMIEELQQFGLNIQVADSLADAEETERHFGIRLTPWEELSPADALILAMPHKEIREGGWTRIRRLLKNQNSIVFDIKGVLDKNNKPEAVELWRL